MALVKFRLRRDTATDWLATNPVLALGEPGLEVDTRQVKYGDGATAWNDLPYAQSLDFQTRADAVALIPFLPVDDGKTFTAGDERYRWKVGATDIPDMPGCIPIYPVRPEHFGAVPWSVGSSPDSWTAICYADLWCHGRGWPLEWRAGVYGSTDGISRLAEWRGAGSPALAPFPLTGDDKQYLRPGYKHLIPGTVLLFTGTGTATHTTQRSDAYASFTYCVKTIVQKPLKDMGIVLDCDVYDAGGTFTAWATDNRANYGVGHVVNAGKVHQSAAIFGYFPVGGTVIHTFAGMDGGDPDYCIIDGSTMGRHGMALIGSDSDDSFRAGLSGTVINALCYANDHHNRSDATDRITQFGGAGDWTPLFIDGRTGALQAALNGTTIGGMLRSYCTAPFKFDAASNIKFIGTVFETPSYAGVPNASTKQVGYSTRTSDITFMDARMNNAIGLENMGAVMAGELILIGSYGNYNSGIIRGSGDGTDFHWTRLGAGSGTDDPAFQFGKGSIASSTEGWVFRRDISNADTMDIRWNNNSVFRLFTDGGVGNAGYAYGGTKTIAGGAIVVGNYSYYTLGTEGAAASDDLDTITDTAAYRGKVIILQTFSSSQDVVIKATGGNIRALADINLTHPRDMIMLLFDGTNWVPLNFMDNAA